MEQDIHEQTSVPGGGAGNSTPDAAAVSESPLTAAEVPVVAGCFSLLDRLGDILTTPEGRQLFDALLPRLMAALGKTEAPSAPMMRFFSGVQLLRLANMAGMMGVAISRQELLEINAALCGIRKPR